MNIIFVTPRYEDDGFDTFLGPSLQMMPAKCINIADKPDTDEVKKISFKYNIGVELAKKQNLIDKDSIIVFCKSNVHIMDTLFKDKLSIIFKEMPNVGVVGVVGTKQLHKGASLYSIENQPVNGIIYARDVKNDKGEHIQYSKNGFYNEIVAIDDSIIAIRACLFIEDGIKFESNTDEGYGIEIAIKSILNGYDTVVADILVVSHQEHNHNYKTINKIVDGLGVSFPITPASLGKHIIPSWI